MAKLLFSIAAAILFYLLKFDVRSIMIFAAFAIPTSVYFFVRKSRKPDVLHTITLILTVAAMILPKLRGGETISVTPFYIALCISVLYDLIYPTKLWYLTWFAFWGCTGFGLFEVAKTKLADKSWLIFVAIVLIGLRDLFERRKSCGTKVCTLTDERTVGTKNDS
ncbi:MAG TPA: hypothetical protein PLP64_07260 [Pseudothermotoga sp.]|nr:hypothetical protein [Pseudothermotoga sp.]